MIYTVECVHCRETLLTTAQIGDAEARIVGDIPRAGDHYAGIGAALSLPAP